jgi:hypothetical protein
MMNSWYYQLPLPARREEAEGVAALLRLAEGLAGPLPGAVATGGGQGGVEEPAIS